MPIFATSALFTIIVGVANMATTKATGLPKKQLSPSKKKASSPIKRELTTMTISTKKKMGKSSYVCKIMQFKNEFALIWCIKQYHPNQDAFLCPCHQNHQHAQVFCKAGDSSRLSTTATMVEKSPQLLQ
jgi:5-formyltetrahydrofolate cyclo-ligase